MIKRYLALLFIPLMLLFYGCNEEPKPRLTVEEYAEAMDNAWCQYRDEGYGAFIQIVLEAENDFYKMREKKDAFLEACDKMDQAMDKILEINPPAEYQSLHEKVTASIEDEKRWSEYRRKAFSAETQEESDEYLDKIAEEAGNRDPDESFTYLCVEIYQKTHNLEF